jgi:phosphatidylglycerophosphate synthase
MARKIVIVSLRILGVLFILWGVLTFTDVVDSWGSPDYPALLFVLYVSYGCACILLGIMSWKHAPSFTSTWGALLLLVVRIITFSLAFMCVTGVATELEASSAPGASEMELAEVIIEGVLAFIFLGITFWLTTGNREKSEKRTMTIQTSGRYVIDPRDYRSDRFSIGCLVAFWLIWAPVTAIITYLAYTKREPFLFVWLVFGYLGTIGIPIAIFFKNQKQVLEIAGDSLVVYGAMGNPWSKVRIHKQNLKALTLERYEDPDTESVYTLNLFQKPDVRPQRIMLASFVHPKDKAILFEEIREFLQNNGFEFTGKNKMA